MYSCIYIAHQTRWRPDVRDGPCTVCRSLSCSPAVCSRSLRVCRPRWQQMRYHSERGRWEGVQAHTETSFPVISWVQIYKTFTCSYWPTAPPIFHAGQNYKINIHFCVIFSILGKLSHTSAQNKHESWKKETYLQVVPTRIFFVLDFILGNPMVRCYFTHLQYVSSIASHSLRGKSLTMMSILLWPIQSWMANLCVWVGERERERERERVRPHTVA